MMQVLEAGGVPILTDNIRKADEDNPAGYYEFERVKQLPKGDKSWVADADGRAVKVISRLLEHLPQRQYKVIFMHRRMPELLASQRKMIVHRGQPPDSIDDEAMTKAFESHLGSIFTWLSSQPNIEVLDVRFSELVGEPLLQVQRIAEFLGGGLDVEKMAAVVKPGLYRNRAANK
jgi:hypothetical protein